MDLIILHCVGFEYILDYGFVSMFLCYFLLKMQIWNKNLPLHNVLCAETEAHAAFAFPVFCDIMCLYCLHGSQCRTWYIEEMHRNPVWRMKKKEVSRSLKSSRLKERNLESGQKGRRRGKGKSGGKTRIMPMFVSFLSLWHFRGQWVCVPVCVS